MDFLLYVICPVMSIAVIAIGVRLGIGPLLQYKNITYSKESLVYGLRAKGLLSQEEYKEINAEYAKRRRAIDDQESLRETLLELKELGFISEAGLEDKLLLLQQPDK